MRENRPPGSERGRQGNLAFLPRYDAGKGRWINRDPIGEEGGVNLYLLSGNGGHRSIDIFGLLPCHLDSLIESELINIGKSAGWRFLGGKAAKGAAKAGLAAAVDGPVPVGEVVGVGILLWDVGSGIFGGAARYWDFSDLRDVLNEQAKEIKDLEAVEECCYILKDLIKGSLREIAAITNLDEEKAVETEENPNSEGNETTEPNNP